MINKEQLLQSIIQECNVCKHLYSKIPEGYDFNYRPNENMRTTLELIQYLTFAPYEFAAAMLCDTFKTNDWTSYSNAEKNAASLKPENFPEAMDVQIEKFRKMFAGLNEDELNTREVVPGWSLNKTLGANLIDMPLKTAVAYRMQFFIYLKSSCCPQLHTGNCWDGMDF
ncbi:MAG: hypothetical protein EHM58_03825 [Ignavibacteriae bacterium]|nr:MAG: hypothetical protein EHM58_03825 [Ignavibacteriota bacterium]